MDAAPKTLQSLDDALLAVIFEHVGAPSVGAVAQTCRGFKAVAGDIIKARREAVLRRVNALTHLKAKATNATFLPADLKPLRSISTDFLEPAVKLARAWGLPCTEAENVLKLAGDARAIDYSLVSAVEKMGKPELVTKLRQHKIHLEHRASWQLAGEVPEGHTVLLSLLPHGVAPFLEGVGFSASEADVLQEAVRTQKADTEEMERVMRTMLTAEEEAGHEAAFQAHQAHMDELEKKNREKAEIVARAKADSRLCIHCGNPPRTHKMIGCDHIMLCGGCRASLEDQFKTSLANMSEDPRHPMGGAFAEHNAIALTINCGHMGAGCTCLICPKRDVKFNMRDPEDDDDEPTASFFKM